jgi:hypothetical protein
LAGKESSAKHRRTRGTTRGGRYLEDKDDRKRQGGAPIEEDSGRDWKADARVTRRLVTVSVPASEKARFLKALARLQARVLVDDRRPGSKGRKSPLPEAPHAKKADGTAAPGVDEAERESGARNSKLSSRAMSPVAPGPFEKIVIELIAE